MNSKAMSNDRHAKMPGHHAPRAVAAMRNKVAGQRLAGRRVKDAIALSAQQRRSNELFSRFLHRLVSPVSGGTPPSGG
ncbi:hypothetical protein F4827_005054 [Paraburkholderia bannensis]|uniref:Uncharacterized protein n=1 Tax=Paraburkholderia bannensis TaxID=765414 RepID=A0A7W9U1C8_9BURK|nr:hypothetical protein [Paraburkholderia sp. WP4_3_2]MBB6105188.1 hypothetical protein [Paraburkholderia bannensis]